MHLAMFHFCQNVVVFSELKRARAQIQPDHQKQSRSQSGQRAQQGSQEDQGAPAKRLKLNLDTQQQLANSAPGKTTLRSLLNSPPCPSPQQPLLSTTPQTQHFNLSCQNTPPVSSSPNWPQLHNTPFSYLPARIGRSGGGTRRGPRQTLVERSLARRIVGKERLSFHLRQSLLCDRGEEAELLTYQDITDDLQVRTVGVLVRTQHWSICSHFFWKSIYRCHYKHQNTCQKCLSLAINTVTSLDFSSLPDGYYDAS